MYSHQGNTVQIEAPEFDPDIDGDSPASTDERHQIAPAQGTLATIPEVSEPEDDNSSAPEAKKDQKTYKETDWPDAPPIQIPRISSSSAQQPEQGHNRHQAQPSAESFNIPELEENSEEEQFSDFDPLWHIITHTKPVSTYDKNIFPTYKNWTTTNITLKLTEQTSLRVHQLHKTIGWQTIR